MAASDFAVLIGINRYPMIQDLNAPVYDAIRFYQWLRHPAFGNVPKERIKLLCSPIRRACWGQRPTYGTHIDPIFKPMVTNGRGRLTSRDGELRGRRFYLYLAGHGIEHAHEDKYAALLMADADLNALACEHLPGVVYAQGVQFGGYFDEVVLFMDTCRESCLLTAKKAFYNVVRHVQPEEPKKFFGLAARWGREGREIPRETRRHWTGRFSSFVLDGLNGAARMRPAPSPGLRSSNLSENATRNSWIQRRRSSWERFLYPTSITRTTTSSSCQGSRLLPLRPGGSP